MKFCLNNPNIVCTAKPILISKLTYRIIIHFDGSKEKVWHKHPSCVLAHPSCGNKAYAQLPLKKE